MVVFKYVDVLKDQSGEKDRHPMWRSTGQKILKRLLLRESWIIFFILGNVMLNFPFLKIFNQPTTILGFPLLYLYFMIGWPVSIGVIYLFATAIEHEASEQHSKEQNPP
jgi:hypothetical protein